MLFARTKDEDRVKLLVSRFHEVLGDPVKDKP